MSNNVAGVEMIYIQFQSLLINMFYIYYSFNSSSI